MPDAEIDAMSAVANALTDLSPEERQRVLRWARDRFGVVISDDSRGGGGRRDGEATPDEEDGEEAKADPPAFEHLAELFAATEPENETDKALVAGYFLQVIKGQEKWTAAEAQKELKNMGHALSNVSKSLTRNIRQRPQRVIQLQKSGSSQQARKTYKVTHEGLVVVQGMLGR